MNTQQISISKYGFSAVQIETMSTCNMNCQFCIYPQRRDKGKVLSTDIVYSIIDLLSKDKGVKEVLLQHINEPLLDKRIYGFIKYAKDKGLAIHIITNGILFNSREVISKLIEARPDSVKVSLQTLNQMSFNYIRGIKIDFQEYKKNISEFLKIAQDNSLKVVVDLICNFSHKGKRLKAKILGTECGSPYLYDTLSDLRDDLRQFLKHLNRYDSRLKSNVDIDEYLSKVSVHYAGNQKPLILSENISFKIKRFVDWNRLTTFYPSRNPDVCPSRVIGILASGNVVPCCFAYDDLLCMGDIKRESIYDILEKNAGFLDNLRKGANMPLTCRRCSGALTRRGLVIRWLRQNIVKALQR